jgi:hypothetical protein
MEFYREQVQIRNIPVEKNASREYSPFATVVKLGPFRSARSNVPLGTD